MSVRFPLYLVFQTSILFDLNRIRGGERGGRSHFMGFRLVGLALTQNSDTQIMKHLVRPDVCQGWGRQPRSRMIAVAIVRTDGEPRSITITYDPTALVTIVGMRRRSLII
jgi:hypothetical protein